MPFSDMSFTFYHHLPLFGESEENLVDELIIEVTLLQLCQQPNYSCNVVFYVAQYSYCVVRRL